MRNQLSSTSNLSQASLPGLCPITSELENLAEAGAEKRGAIFTKVEVVNFMLDLIGYNADRPLHTNRILEPSFGEGDFLLPIITRLLEAWNKQKSPQQSASELVNCICSVELHNGSYQITYEKVLVLLKEHDIKDVTAIMLADAWLIQGDFLTLSIDGYFDYVTGNPPYIRQEIIPDVLVAEYRARYNTLYDRADIYVAFIERTLNLLSDSGKQGFICSDRWMKNKYGGPLRQMISDNFNLKYYIDMVNTDAFHAEVSAYPAITVITRGSKSSTRVSKQPEISTKSLSKLSNTLLSTRLPGSRSGVKELQNIAIGKEPWILHEFDKLAIVRRLEERFARIEDTGCKVGIGVATGADKAFIGMFDELDVESDRKLPIAMTRDILSGEVVWRGQGVINPFAEEGGLVNLEKYPKLARYLEERKDQIDKRHVAKKSPKNWYRTIDRIYPKLANQPKLLIPDIKGNAHIVYEDGNLYPHHNLYYIVSNEWDLHALRAVLTGGIGELFVSTYSTRMRGGYLRFQAQYLRRIRLPMWDEVPQTVRQALIDSKSAQETRDAICELYKLTGEEANIIWGSDEDSKS